jgi:hypothetical protein
MLSELSPAKFQLFRLGRHRLPSCFFVTCNFFLSLNGLRLIWWPFGRYAFIGGPKNPNIGPYMKKYLMGKAGGDSESRMRLIRLIENIPMGTGAVSYLTESIDGAGSPQAQKIMITRLADLESAKSYAYQLCGIENLQ